jgi:hypothetical protein
VDHQTETHGSEQKGLIHPSLAASQVWDTARLGYQLCQLHFILGFQQPLTTYTELAVCPVLASLD